MPRTPRKRAGAAAALGARLGRCQIPLEWRACCGRPQARRGWPLTGRSPPQRQRATAQAAGARPRPPAGARPPASASAAAPGDCVAAEGAAAARMCQCLQGRGARGRGRGLGVCVCKVGAAARRPWAGCCTGGLAPQKCASFWHHRARCRTHPRSAGPPTWRARRRPAPALRPLLLPLPPPLPLGRRRPCPSPCPCRPWLPCRARRAAAAAARRRAKGSRCGPSGLAQYQVREGGGEGLGGGLFLGGGGGGVWGRVSGIGPRQMSEDAGAPAWRVVGAGMPSEHAA
jgi:hypothetical protein